MRERFLDFLVWWVGFMGRRPISVLAVSIVLAAASINYAGKNLGINSDTAGLVDENAPFQVYWNELDAVFPGFVDLLVIAVEGTSVDETEEATALIVEALRNRPDLFKTISAPGSDPFFKTNGLLYLEADELSELVDNLANAQPALSKLAADPSLRGVFGVVELGVKAREDGEAVPESLDVLAEQLAVQAEAVADGGTARLSWSSQIIGETPGSNIGLILTGPKLDFDAVFPGAKAIDYVRDIEESLKSSDAMAPDVELAMTGDVMLTYDELSAAAEGVGRAGLVSLVLLAIILWFGLRSLRVIVAIYGTLFVGLAWAGAYATATVGELNMISSACAVLFIGLGIDHAIHFSLRFREASLSGLSSQEALRKTARGVGAAMSLCAASSAIGFMSFVPTQYKGFADLGVIAGGSMFIALLASLTVLPAALQLLRVGDKIDRARSFQLISVAVWRTWRPRFALGLAALSIAALYLAKDAEFDFSTIALKDPTSESVVTLQRLSEEGFVTDYSAFVLAADLDEAQRLAGALEQRPEISDALTPLDLVPSEQDLKLEIIEEAADFLWPVLYPPEVQPAPGQDETLRVTQDFVDQIAGPGKLAAAQPSLTRLASALQRILALDDPGPALASLEQGVVAGFDASISKLGQSLNAHSVVLADIPDAIVSQDLAPDGQARVSILPADDVADYAALKSFVAAVIEVAPEATGRPVAEVGAGNIVIGSFQFATILALGLISLLLLVILRRFGDVLLVLLPIALAASLTVATTVLMDMPFNFANVIVLPLLLGFGVDSGIHLVARRRDERSVDQVMDSSTPRAIGLSALTTIASFGSLSLSPHYGTASMGILLTLSMLYTVACAVIVLPAVIDWRDSRKSRQL